MNTLIDRVRAGERVADVAVDLGMSRSWAYQILREHKVPVRRRRSSAEAARVREARAEALDMLRLGATREEAAAATGLTLEETPLGYATSPGARYSNEDILDALRTAAGDSPTLTLSQYKAARVDGDPSPSIIIRRFGSWVDAAAAAGLSSGVSTRDNYARLGPSDVTPEIRDFIEAGGTTMAQWRAGGWEPSVATVVNIYGSWTAAMRAGWSASADS